MRRFRSVIAGILTVAALGLAVPAQAAGPDPGGVGSVWTSIVDWIGTWWSAATDAVGGSGESTAAAPGTTESVGTDTGGLPPQPTGPIMDPHG